VHFLVLTYVVQALHVGSCLIVKIAILLLIKVKCFKKKKIF